VTNTARSDPTSIELIENKQNLVHDTMGQTRKSTQRREGGALLHFPLARDQAPVAGD